jgi:hypothetical protein
MGPRLLQQAIFDKGSQAEATLEVCFAPAPDMAHEATRDAVLLIEHDPDNVATAAQVQHLCLIDLHYLNGVDSSTAIPPYLHHE